MTGFRVPRRMSPVVPWVVVGVALAAWCPLASAQSAGDYRSNASGNWSTTGTWQRFDGTNWVAAVASPTSADGAITIRSPNTVTLDASTTVDQVTVAAGATLATAATLTNASATTTILGTFQINQGGWATGVGFTYAPGATLVFGNGSGSYGVNADAYWPATNGPPNVSVSGAGGITMNVARTVSGTFQTSAGVVNGNNLTLNGTTQIFSGGYFTGSPVYGSGSTLTYTTGGTYGVGAEWTGSGAGAGGARAAGSGQPQNVTIANTTLNLDGSPRALPGNLIVSGGGLSLANGGDLAIGGNWNRALLTTFAHNNVGVWFNAASGTQVLTGPAGGETFGYLLHSGAGSLQLATSIACTGTTGEALQLLGAGLLDLGLQTLTMSGGGALKVSGGNRAIAGGTVRFTAATSVTSTSGGTLVFASSAKAELTKGVAFGATTFNGTLQLDSGGFVNGVAPTYAPTSTLVYNNPNGYNVALEWGSTAGAAPTHVAVQQGTVVLPNSPRTVSGNLTFNGGAMTLSGSNLTVNNILSLGASVVTTGSATLTANTVVRTTGYVDGTLQRPVPTGSNETVTFDVGSAGTYAPVTVTFANVTSGGSLAASTTSLGGTPPNAASGVSATKFVNRKWTLANAGTVFTTCAVTLGFGAGDVLGGASPAAFVVAKNTGGTWSQPAVGTRTATSTQATGLASFGDVYVGEAASYAITASAGAHGAIAPSGTVSVASGGAQAFSLSPEPCYAVADVIVDGVSVGAVSSYTFTNVLANHTITASFAHAPASVPAVDDLQAAQLVAANDTDGTTKIQLTFTSPQGTTVEVWRKAFGGYPLYDDGGGVPPAAGAYPPAGWTQTGVTASGQFDEPPSRDVWYYVAYAKDACGNASPSPPPTAGTLDYHLGDVTDGVTNGTGDNTVSTADISLLGAHYGQSGAALAGYEYLDVGPTTTGHTDGRPTTDGRLEFEDFVLYVINYTPTVSSAKRAPGPVASLADIVSAGSVTSVTAGQEFDVVVALSGAGDVQALSVALRWNPAIAQPLSATAGEFVTDAGGVVFEPSAGTVDAALLGAGRTFTGEGTIATVRFRALASGDPGIAIDHVIARDANNEAVAVTVAQGTLGVPNLPGATELRPVAPNPARGAARLDYALARAGRIDLAIYSVDGRRVTTLASGESAAGRFSVVWNGRADDGRRLAAGMYYARLRAEGSEFTRAIVRLE